MQKHFCVINDEDILSLMGSTILCNMFPFSVSFIQFKAFELININNISLFKDAYLVLCILYIIFLSERNF